MRGLAIWGSGGHGRVVFDAAIAMNAFDRIAFYDDAPAPSRGPALDGITVFTGGIVHAFEAGYQEFIIAIGSNTARAQCFERALQAHLQPVTCIHPTAWISPSATIGAGTVVMARVVVQSQARIGRNCILNTAVVVEHDCAIGDHTHLSPSAALGGAVTVGEYAHLGIGAIALPGARVGDRTIIGAGAVVLKEIPPDVTAVGVPARICEHRRQH